MRSALMMVAAAAALTAGCGATVHSAVSPDANLSQYKSYSFHVDPTKTGQTESLVDQDITSSLRQSLASKGFVEATNGAPDFLVAYHTKTQQETEVSGPYAYGYGIVGWGPDITTYTTGTLIVDFVDPRTNKVFWRGTASQVVDHPGSPDAAKIDKAVSKLVNQYPYSMASAERPTM